MSELSQSSAENTACRVATTCRLAGQRFGKLVVTDQPPLIKNVRKYFYHCVCDCGGQRLVRSTDLKSGKVRDCGCEQLKEKDLTNQRFGHLTALWPTEKRKKNRSVIWHCRCDCGNELDISRNYLMSGKCISCGCEQKCTQDRISNLINLTYVDGTCLERLKNCEKKSSSAVGRRGIYKRKNGRYAVSIGFKGKTYWLGLYDDLPSAVEVREEAEKSLYNSVINAYKAWSLYSEKDPSWGKKHPFHVDVVHDHKQLSVVTSYEGDMN